MKKLAEADYVVIEGARYVVRINQDGLAYLQFIVWDDEDEL
jgi:hypothetical protein